MTNTDNFKYASLLRVFPHNSLMEALTIGVKNWLNIMQSYVIPLRCSKPLCTSYILVGMIFIINSCIATNCDEISKHFRENYSFNFIVEMKNIEFGKENVFRGTFYGSDSIKMEQEFRYTQIGTLYIDTEIGDTLFKKTNSPTVELHKRDTVYFYYLECGGKSYND